MNTRLELIARSDAGLGPEALHDLERQVKALADLCERDSRSMERLAYACAAALRAEEIGHSAVQRFLNCLIGGRAWAAVQQDLKAVQYGAQFFLQEIMDRALLGYDLLTALINHLSGTEDALAAALAQYRDEMAAGRGMEYSAGFVSWLNDLEGKPLTHGVPFWTMDTASRLVWLARDFWEATGGRWTTAELLMLEDAMGVVGLSPSDPISYFDFARSAAGDSALRQRLLGGSRLMQTPEGHLLPLAVTELLALLDGEKRSAVDAVVTSMNLRGSHTSRTALRDALVSKLIGRQVSGGGPVSCLNFLLELLYDLRAAERDGLMAPPLRASDELCWEIRLFRRTSDVTGWRGGYGSGSGSGSGSGRSGSGRSASGSGRLGSGWSGSGSGSGRFGSGSGSGRFGSNGSAAAPEDCIFAGGGLTGDGFGGVYGLELIDAPRTESSLLDWLLTILGGGALL